LEPVERNGLLQTAVPLLNGTLEHKVVDVVLSTNFTVPVGFAAPEKVGVTVAVKATG